MLRRVLLLFACGVLFLTGQTSAQSSANVFRNTDPSVAYTGSASCVVAGCHEEVGRTYWPSPHGQSMAPANRPQELARAPHPFTVFNARNRRSYTVYQQGGNLYQSVEEKDKAGRTLYRSTHKLDYVAGGERTGYSYLFSVGRWMFQAPLSFYAPSQTWELSPGYAADDPGFTRVMTTGCLVCHNGQPDPVSGRDGMYKVPPFRFGELGIGCEACHGPGALHVKEMKEHKGRVLRANQVDTSIVNPARLSPRVADDICQLCHQAGDAVVNIPGKGDTDFRPGTELAETMAILKLPIKPEQRSEANRLETRPPVRGSLEMALWWKNSTMELSRCYTASHGKLTCSTCHSTHHGPGPGQEKAAYRAACLKCHTETSCTLKPDAPQRVAAGDYCVACHMERRAVAGIAHSNDTKHRIVRTPGQPLPETAFEQPRPDLPGLLWMNRPAEGGTLPGAAQLEAYWTAARKDPAMWALWARKLNELKEENSQDADVLNALGVVALAQKKDYAHAAEDFEGAMKAGSGEPTTFLNLAAAFDGMGSEREAETVLQHGAEAYPWNGAILIRWAAQCVRLGEPDKARGALAAYNRMFPEDANVREALRTVEKQATLSPSSGRGAPVSVPK